MASTSSALSVLSLEHEHDDLDLEPMRSTPQSQQQTKKSKGAKRQRKNVFIINFLVVLFTLGIFSILVEYTAIADRAARTSGMHPSHLNSDVSGGGGGGTENGGATHLFSSVVDVYEEEEYDEELENGGNATPLPPLAFMPNLPIDELMQMNQLFDACMTQKDTVIDGTGAPSSSFPSTLSERDSPELLLEKMRVCPDVDVFVPAAVRGDNEYCQDAAVYTKFLQSRMLPRWVLDKELRDESANRTVTYFDLCPKTPMLFLNHHWDALPSHAKWSSQELKTKTKKPVFLMPNIDSTQLRREHLLGADVVLCKTKACFSRVSAWYAQEAQRGNRRDTKVLYTRHTSPNPSVPLQMLSMEIAQKEYGKPKFVHLGGDLKGTKQVLDCWLSRGRELPRLEISMDDAKYSSGFKSEYDTRIRKSENVQVDTRARSPSSLEWSKLVTESTFFLAPSESESYGHTINQARAAGGVVITTDVAPMNELMPSSASSMDVLVHAKRKINPNQFLGSGFTNGGDGLQGGKGLVAEFSGKHVCDAVDTLLRATQEQTRQAMGVHAHRQYFTDMNVFAGAMQELREYARSKSGENVAEGASPTPTTKAPEGVQRLGNLRVDTAAFSNPPSAVSP